MATHINIIRHYPSAFWKEVNGVEVGGQKKNRLKVRDQVERLGILRLPEKLVTENMRKLASSSST